MDKWKSLWKSVDNSPNLNLAALKEAGALQFFMPGHPLWRLSGRLAIRQGSGRRKYMADLGWAAKAAANANGLAWAKMHIPMEGPLALGVTIFRAAPPTNKPDISNYVKLVEDALTEAHIFIDDARIVEYLPGTAKRESKLEGVRVVLVPHGRMGALGFK